MSCDKILFGMRAQKFVRKPNSLRFVSISLNLNKNVSNENFQKTCDARIDLMSDEWFNQTNQGKSENEFMEAMRTEFDRIVSSAKKISEFCEKVTDPFSPILKITKSHFDDSFLA